MTFPRTSRAAFTLMELMISIALALLLILGVNAVFSLTAKTVGAAHVLTTANQNDRAAQAVMANDFQHADALSSTPCFVIESALGYAFRNRADQLGDSDGYADTADVAGGSTGMPAALYGPRTHRLSRIGFFSRGLFQRQTGTGNAFIDTVKQPATGAFVPFASNEAWIVYGHLNVADNAGQFSTNTFPGALTPVHGSSYSPRNPPGPDPANPNNFYASQWILGRSVFLLAPQPQGAGYIAGQPKPDVPDGTLKPLAYGSYSADTQWIIDNSRYDAVQGGILDFRKTLTRFVAIPGDAAQTPQSPYDLTQSPIHNTSWYWDLLVSSLTNRYCGNPLVGKLITSVSAAQMAPCFLSGCTHFTVEFAGDFVTQNDDSNSSTYGTPIPNKALVDQYKNPTLTGPDGTIDYEVVNGVRQIRWYGLARKTAPDPAGTGNISWNTDVVPLRDVLAANGLTWPSLTLGGTKFTPQPSAPFERVYPTNPASGPYGGLSASDRYVVAWGPDTQATTPPTPTPMMLRITITLDDPSNRTGSGQTFEYVVSLPQ